jgi:preprotein translocase subunit YajC
MPGLLIILVLFGLMWLLLIRPQQQRMRRQRALVASIDVGDEVVSAGGIVGRVVSVDDQQVILEVAPDPIHLTLLRAAINRKLAEPGVAGPPDAPGDGNATGHESTSEGPSDEGVS